MDSRARSGSSKAVTRGPSSTPSRCSRIGTLERRALAPSFTPAPPSFRRSNESKGGGGALLPWPTPVRPRRQRQAQYARAAIEGARADDGRGRPRHAPASEATTALRCIGYASPPPAQQQSSIGLLLLLAMAPTKTQATRTPQQQGNATRAHAWGPLGREGRARSRMRSGTVAVVVGAVAPPPLLAEYRGRRPRRP